MSVKLRKSAKATGFSVATVSQAHNGRPCLVSGESQQILGPAKELGYRSNLARRSLHSACTNTIGLIVDNSVGPFSTIVINVDFDSSEEFCVIQEMINSASMTYIGLKN